MVAASPYYTPAEVRGRVATLGATDRFPGEMLAELVDEYERIAERARGVAYVRRQAIETRVPDPSGTIRPLNPVGALAVDSVAVDSIAWTVDQLAQIRVYGTMRQVIAGPWPCHTNVTLTYTHGFDAPPPGILRGCREFVRAKALEQSGNGPRNTIGYTDDSGFSYRESTADWTAGRYTGIRVVDDAINSEVDYRGRLG